jgi:hypothetical protein
MLNIIVRIQNVDMNGFCGRDHHPTKDMEGCFVRITNMNTVPQDDDDGSTEGMSSDAHGAYQVFFGILLDANGEDVEDGEVELIDHEIESLENMPVLFSAKE